MTDLEEQVLEMILKFDMIHTGDHVACGLSGGADSVCLLYLLLACRKKFSFELSAVHINHGIREEADLDELYVRKLCRRTGVPLTVIRVDVSKEKQKTRESTETAARRLRYEAFDRLQADRVALAHHRRDQAETVLLHLIRGAGSEGLCGMRPVRGRYIRPLLDIDPSDLRAYLSERRIGWIEDQSNQDTTYRRNYLRHEVMPLLETMNPQAAASICRTACLLQEDETWIRTLTLEALANARTPGGGLSVIVLESFPEALKKRVIREFLRQDGGVQDIGQNQIQAILHLLKAQSGTQAMISTDRIYIREYDQILCQKPDQKPADFTLPDPDWEGQIPDFGLYAAVTLTENIKIDALSLQNEYTKYFDYDTMKHTLMVRTRQNGDYLTMAGGHKTLKKYMSDEKIPAHLRDSIPVLASGSHILWIPGYRMSDACKVKKGTKRVISVTLRPERQKEEPHA